ncbi:DUF7344 domain-containing protein [Natronorubrum thiooxidans]|uniref:DUF7344 domain-containing protein n=1 Tax=Natronorubrum thiooxidans TaxID=308853 RepID=A0A1N7G115_9EURY|nr:hypothetical protein [Natronorubrum thiooxidans]SIS06251.1 hypothetical protein SAMN05421752_10995 [Natronorubrum thiooxidans]
MSASLTAERTTTAFDVLADPRRRYLLSILYERTGSDGTQPTTQSDPLSISTLATDVAAREHGCPIVTDEQCQEAHIELVHHHIPRLRDVGLVTVDTDGDTRTISLTEHPILELEWVAYFLEQPTGGTAIDEAALECTLDALQPARCRLACVLLARRRDGLSVADLAAMIAAHEGDTELVSLSESDWQPIATALRHNYLPSLAAADLIDYDDSSETATIAPDAPQWRADWLAASPLREAIAALETRRNEVETGPPEDGAADGTSARAGSCWTLEGADRVITRSHELADSADEELFVTMPDEAMVQQRCLERWRAATDRGVDVYVGSRSPRVRDTVRSAVPEATVCEPQFDWLNFPVEGIHHGRVVFADRERVLVVTVGDGDVKPQVTAITGDGPASTLVRLVREHVGPRLDRLQSRCADGVDELEQETPLPL